jgi:hypothetical protein
LKCGHFLSLSDAWESRDQTRIWLDENCFSLTGGNWPKGFGLLVRGTGVAITLTMAERDYAGRGVDLPNVADDYEVS